jgi:hypothetical protein
VNWMMKCCDKRKRIDDYQLPFIHTFRHCKVLLLTDSWANRVIF